jgi:DNA-binding winged helix-turn-helix (wHTH) protein
MSKRKIYIYCVLISLVFFGWIFSDSNDENEDFPETVKIALREVGNQLLLSNQDSTSLVLPILELEKYKFKLLFQKELSFEPTVLVAAVKGVFQKAELPNYYRIEVVQCSDDEVAYSFLVKNQSEKDIIPCSGRFLPNKCYTIEVKFTNNLASFLSKQVLFFLLLFVILIFFLDYKLSKRKQIEKQIKMDSTHTKIGVFQFYPEQNKLVKQATEINLSKKECELLAIFVANPNQIIKRDELTKRVWEDHGVFVGRSLDTYISKLRKKLKEDTTIKLTNIHGVGYKLELN